MCESSVPLVMHMVIVHKVQFIFTLYFYRLLPALPLDLDPLPKDIREKHEFVELRQVFKMILLSW